MTSALSLIPLIEYEDELRKAIVNLPVWKQANPKLWEHNWVSDVSYAGHCSKCGKGGVDDCSVPDPFTGSLAELAFELKDKVLQLPKGQELFAKAADRTFLSNFNCESTWYLFWLFTAKPDSGYSRIYEVNEQEAQRSGVSPSRETKGNK